MKLLKRLTTIFEESEDFTFIGVDTDDEGWRVDWQDRSWMGVSTGLPLCPQGPYKLSRGTVPKEPIKGDRIRITMSSIPRHGFMKAWVDTHGINYQQEPGGRRTVTTTNAQDRRMKLLLGVGWRWFKVESLPPQTDVQPT